MPETQPDQITDAFKAYKETGELDELRGLLAAHVLQPVYLHGHASIRHAIRRNEEGRKAVNIEPYYLHGLPRAGRVPWALPENRLLSISEESILVEARVMRDRQPPSRLKLNATYALGFALEDLTVLRGK